MKEYYVTFYYKEGNLGSNGIDYTVVACEQISSIKDITTVGEICKERLIHKLPKIDSNHLEVIILSWEELGE